MKIAKGLLTISALFIMGCDLFDFRDLGITSSPESPSEILGAATSEVWIEFDSDVVRSDIERAFSVNSEAGSVETDEQWAERRFVITPVEGFQAGLRYTLSLRGEIRTLDGRRFRENLNIPF